MEQAVPTFESWYGVKSNTVQRFTVYKTELPPIWYSRLNILLHVICCFPLLPAVGGNASLVRRGLSCQREELRNHGQPVGHRDPEGDRHQQPSAPTQTPLGNPGDGLPHQPVRTAHLQNGKQQVHIHVNIHTQIIDK